MSDFKRLHETIKMRHRVLASLPTSDKSDGAMEALRDIAVWMGFKGDLNADTKYQIAIRNFVEASLDSGLTEVCFGYNSRLFIVKKDKGLGYHWMEHNSKPAAHSSSVSGVLDTLFSCGW